jgi:hypothetical protein
MSNITFHIWIKTSADNPNDQCPICLDTIQVGEKIAFHETAQKINHSIHFSCFKNYMLNQEEKKIKPRCPYDRSIIDNLIVNCPLNPDRKSYINLQRMINESHNWEQNENSNVSFNDLILETMLFLGRIRSLNRLYVSISAQRHQNNLIENSAERPPTLTVVFIEENQIPPSEEMPPSSNHQGFFSRLWNCFFG